MWPPNHLVKLYWGWGVPQTGRSFVELLAFWGGLGYSFGRGLGEKHPHQLWSSYLEVVVPIWAYVLRQYGHGRGRERISFAAFYQSTSASTMTLNTGHDTFVNFTPANSCNDVPSAHATHKYWHSRKTMGKNQRRGRVIGPAGEPHYGPHAHGHCRLSDSIPGSGCPKGGSLGWMWSGS